MKKAAAFGLAAAVLAAGVLGINGGFGTIIADVQAEGGTAEEETAEDRASQIDTSVPVQAGSRVAAVSKNVNGEFWDLIRQGMEDAVEDINTAYGFEGDDVLTMTFEGPNDELKVEEQVNTLDAVIAENPTVLCLSASDMDSLQAQLESAAENGIPVIVFDSKKFKLEGISDEFRWILAPIVMRSAFQRVNVHLEHYRRHPLAIRRYYRHLDY